MCKKCALKNMGGNLGEIKAQCKKYASEGRVADDFSGRVRNL